MPTVKLPNGQTASFPDNMAPDDIQKAIESDPNSGAFPAGASGPLPGVPKAPNPMQPPTLMDRAATALTNAGDVVTGAGKGALHTLSSTDQFARDHLPAVLTNSNMGFGKPADLQHVQQMATPTNTAQKIGYGGEQVGEFLAPMGAEKALVKGAMEGVPALAKAAPLVRTAASALSSGAVNKAQGGSFTGGAAAGAAGGAFSEGLKAVAPLIAESAIGVRSPDRAFGRNGGTVGNAILSETKGVNPGNIARQAGEKVQGYNAQLEGLAKDAGNVDLLPARQVSKQAEKLAAQRNNPEVIKRTGQLSDQLNFEGGKAPAPQMPPPKVIPGFNPTPTGSPFVPPATGVIPQQVPAMRALQMKRGIGDLQGSWNPATPNKLADATVGRLYHTLDSGLDEAIPGSQQLNSKMSALMPVEARAGATDLNAGVMQRVMGRLTRPTGAMIGGAAGAGYGYHEAGLPGAAAGFASGMLLPELLGSPTSQMMLARSANSALVPPVVRAITGTGMQATRKSLYSSKDENTQQK